MQKQNPLRTLRTLGTLRTFCFFGFILILGQASPKPPRIVVLGDSLSEGVSIAAEDTYPAILERKLQKDHKGATVINASISGSTSATGPKRLRWLMRQNPAIVIIELGANDGLRGMDLAAMKKNLRESIGIAKQANVKVPLAGMKVPPNYGVPYSAQFERIFSELKTEEHVALIPFLLANVAGDPKLNIADGIHPNPKGHEIVAATVWEFIEPML